MAPPSPVDDALAKRTGLSRDEAARRLAAHGPNVLPGGERKSLARIALGVLAEPMFVMLVACGIYLALGDRLSAHRRPALSASGIRRLTGLAAGGTSTYLPSRCRSGDVEQKQRRRYRRFSVYFPGDEGKTVRAMLHRWRA